MSPSGKAHRVEHDLTFSGAVFLHGHIRGQEDYMSGKTQTKHVEILI
jgi:hypothetical protein